MVMRVKTMFAKIASGPVVEFFPDIDEQTTPADILMIAEVLRASILAFLSPEEFENRREAFGFGSTTQNDT